MFLLHTEKGKGKADFFWNRMSLPPTLKKDLSASLLNTLVPYRV